ncbi:MAG: hypothetical protein ACTHKX_08090 [Pseudolysinimonas sp.]
MPELDAIPDHWRAVLAEETGSAILGPRGSRLLILAAGPLIPAARALAALREERQWGATDALPADEPRIWREWDSVLAISAGPGEPELLHALRHLPPRVSRRGVTGAPDSTLGPLVDDFAVLPQPRADSLVAQETALLLSARVALGEQLDHLPQSAEAVLGADTPESVPGISHIAIIGSGWTAPLAGSPAHALGLAPGIRAESHATRDIRYGALDHADSRSLLWFMGRVPDDVLDRARTTGAVITLGSRDPLVELLAMQRMARELTSAA